jgi:hypothetical protein
MRRFFNIPQKKRPRLDSSGSLLSIDELPSESGSSPPALPPKGKFVSTGCLAPPALPPKLRNQGKSSDSPKRVSISTDEVRVIGIGGYNDDNDDESRFGGKCYDF